MTKCINRVATGPTKPPHATVSETLAGQSGPEAGNACKRQGATRDGRDGAGMNALISATPLVLGKTDGAR